MRAACGCLACPSVVGFLRREAVAGPATNRQRDEALLARQDTTSSQDGQDRRAVVAVRWLDCRQHVTGAGDLAQPCQRRRHSTIQAAELVAAMYAHKSCALTLLSLLIATLHEVEIKEHPGGSRLHVNASGPLSLSFAFSLGFPSWPVELPQRGCFGRCTRLLDPCACSPGAVLTQCVNQRNPILFTHLLVLPTLIRVGLLTRIRVPSHASISENLRFVAPDQWHKLFVAPFLQMSSSKLVDSESL